MPRFSRFSLCRLGGARVTCLLAIAILVGTTTARAQEKLSPEETERELKRLEALWQAQRTEISTARIEADHFKIPFAGSWSKAAGLALEAKICAVIAAGGIDADLHAALDSFGRRDLNWNKLSFIMDGERRRSRDVRTVTTPQGKQEEEAYDVTFDGTTEIRHMGRQIDLFQGKTHILVPHLQDFRAIPILRGDEPATIERLPGGDLLRASRGRFPCAVDAKTGLLSSWGDGLFVYAQYLPATYAGGIHFPQVSLRISCSGSNGIIDLFRIRTAEFNADIPASEFIVATGKAVVIVDHRTGTPRPIGIAKKSDNAVAAANALVGPM